MEEHLKAMKIRDWKAKFSGENNGNELQPQQKHISNLRNADVIHLN